MLSPKPAPFRKLSNARPKEPATPGATRRSCPPGYRGRAALAAVRGYGPRPTHGDYRGPDG